MKQMTKRLFSIFGLLCAVLCFAHAEKFVDCKDRLVKSVDFSYAVGGVTPERWTVNDIAYDGITVTTTAPYLATGNFANVKMDNTNNLTGTNMTRQYAIVQNPDVLNAAQYADIPVSNGMMVINTKQDGSTDDYATFRVTGLKTGLTYYIEIKLWNVLDYDGRTAHNNFNVGSWDPLLNIAVKANAGDLWAGNDNQNSTWSGELDNSATADWTNGVDANYRKWEMNEGWRGRAITPTTGGTVAVFNGKKILQNNATGFDIVLQRRGDGVAHSVVLGIEYIKIYGCEEEPGINITGNSHTVCEGLDYTLTAVGINSPETTAVEWTLPDGNTLNGTATLPIVSPMGAGTTARYIAKGNWGRDTLILTSKMCCSAYGRSATVFTESFNDADLVYGEGFYHNPKWANIPGLNNTPPSVWINDSVYKYANDYGDGYTINDGDYGVIKSSRDAGAAWGGYTEVVDHTTKSSSGNSGFLFVNANAKNVDDYFYKLKLQNLCPNTTYEFSAWYASIADNTAKVNLTFEIRDSITNALVVPAISTGDVLDYDWHETTLAFTTPVSGATNVYYLQLLNNSDAFGSIWGNDIAIDDIKVTKCMPSVSIFYQPPLATTTVTELETCTKDVVRLDMNKTEAELIALIASSTGQVHIQWYKNTNANAPLTEWTKIEGANGITYDALPTLTTTYYCAKLSAFKAQAENNTDPEPTECGNDAVTSIFTLKYSGFDISTSRTSLEVCEATGNIDLTGNTGTLTGAGVIWGWAKDSESNFVSGYEMSNVLSKKRLRKNTGITAADAGDYYFIVSNGVCRVSEKVIVTTKDCSTTSNLTLTSTNDAGDLCLGDEVSFTLTLANDGAAAADGVEVTFALPSEFEFVSANSSNYNNNVWSAGQMAAGTSKELKITAKAKAVGLNIIQQTFISKADGNPYLWSTATDNYKSQTQIAKIEDCSNSNVVLTKTSNIDAGKEICVGDEVIFTLRLSNENATTDAANIQVIDVLPAELEFISANPASEYGNNVWSAGTIGINAVKTLEIKTKAIAAGNQVVNQAYVSKIDNETYGGYATAPADYKSEASVFAIRQPVTLTLNADRTEVNIGEGVLLTAIPNPNDRLFDYEWQKGILTGENQYELLPIDDKTVEVTVYDNICPSVSATAEIKVNYPNAIVWDRKDDLNGSFLTNTDLRFKLYIFNRMGQEVYVGNSGWNGTYDNKPVDPGAYYYVLKFDSGEVRKAAIEVVKE
ncbi:hypothetical protein FACS189434_11530 [Bacteroidia bacterium]|nr:hypothetical protein FACS189434_11530 [Bacteroidia bacterium]